MTSLLSPGRLLVVVGLLLLSQVSQGQGQVPSLEVDYTVPSGYVARPDGGGVAFGPQTPGDPGTPCAYVLMPPQPSKGSLDVDAGAALLAEAARAGLSRVNDQVIAMRGVAVEGWPYFLLALEFGGTAGGQNIYLNVMAMVFPAPADRVNVLIGAGSLARCTFNDVLFAQLFHSLRPRGWKNPGGNALERDLIGRWEGRGLSQHTFLAGGGYSRSAAGVLFDQTMSTGGGGRYSVRGDEITIAANASGQAPERFRVRIYDTLKFSQWQRAMTVLYDNRRPASVTEYIRIEQ
jgi:hypothetical protein